MSKFKFDGADSDKHDREVFLVYGKICVNVRTDYGYKCGPDDVKFNDGESHSFEFTCQKEFGHALSVDDQVLDEDNNSSCFATMTDKQTISLGYNYNKDHFTG
jgi:hypothetical protein